MILTEVRATEFYNTKSTSQCEEGLLMHRPTFLWLLLIKIRQYACSSNPPREILFFDAELKQTEFKVN